MDALWLDWLNLLTKWSHLIVGIAWIGASFYFNWLEGNLHRAHAGLAPGVAGDLWAVHGGGFYHVEKYENIPDTLPPVLHWFKWEAYLTLITGVMLLIMVFYITPGLSLLAMDSPLSPVQGIALSVLVLVGSWVIYHALCQSRWGKNSHILLALLVVLLTLLAFGLTQVFSAKAVYLHVGAVIGTIMVLNVFFVIIPSQRVMVSALSQQQVPDPIVGKQGLQRSIHNNYFTLPVLFIMISGHYPMTYGHEYGVVILLALSLIGVWIRHYFNLRNRGRVHHWMLAVAVMALLAVVVATTPKPEVAPNHDWPVVGDAQVMAVVNRHCVSCHAEKPTQAGFSQPPGGVILTSPQRIWLHQRSVMAQTVMTHTMPPGNVTRMSDAERQRLARWLQQYDGTKHEP